MVVGFFIFKRLLTLLIITFFWVSQSIMVLEVQPIVHLSLIWKIENNMFQLMDITLNIYQFLLVFQKSLFLDHCYFLFTSMIWTLLKHCNVHNFADDTYLLHINDWIKKLNTAVDSDLKNLTNRINANKFSLNVSLKKKRKNWILIFGLIILMILLLSLTGLMLGYLKGVCKY